MKTIDFLVQTLPGIGGWPNGAIGAGFLSGEGSLYFWDENNDCPSKWTIDTDVEVEDSNEEVSREQYEAALAAKNDGWIEWGGGKHPPVSTNTVVDVKLEKGYVQSGYPAGEYSWEHVWQGSNIIAYRLHKPQEEKQAKADDEADLNDCIGQDVAPAWSGDGLPPVGCECELKFKYHDSDVSWSTVAVLWQRDDDTLVEYIENKLKNTILLIRNTSERVDFRPIRSEADKKREEAIMSIAKAGGAALFEYGEKFNDGSLIGAAWYELYDAIASGKVRGVKLED